MKKKFYLFTLLLMFVSVMHGQHNYFQLPNNNYDYWGGLSTEMPTPTFWSRPPI